MKKLLVVLLFVFCLAAPVALQAKVVNASYGHHHRHHHHHHHYHRR
jgi:Ni/Co efflux regulator RcnB